jgi:hypothetical protein
VEAAPAAPDSVSSELVELDDEFPDLTQYVHITLFLFSVPIMTRLCPY